MWNGNKNHVEKVTRIYRQTEFSAKIIDLNYDY